MMKSILLASLLLTSPFAAAAADDAAAIKRIEPGQYYSAAVVHDNRVYLAGMVASDTSQDVTGQTRQALKAIDEALAKAGSDKSRILRVQVFLRDIDRDFQGMNQAWAEWVDKDQPPARATVQAALASPEYLVEIVVTAAI